MQAASERIRLGLHEAGGPFHDLQLLVACLQIDMHTSITTLSKPTLLAHQHGHSKSGRRRRLANLPAYSSHNPAESKPQQPSAP